MSRIEVRHVTHEYDAADRRITALQGVSFALMRIGKHGLERRIEAQEITDRRMLEKVPEGLNRHLHELHRTR